MTSHSHRLKPSSGGLPDDRDGLQEKTSEMQKLGPAETSEIIEMALSDHTSFAQIRMLYGLSETEVKSLMRKELKTSSYKAWRRRVRQFSDRRAHYK